MPLHMNPWMKEKNEDRARSQWKIFRFQAVSGGFSIIGAGCFGPLKDGILELSENSPLPTYNRTGVEL